MAIERVEPSRHEASTSRAHTKLASTSHSYTEAVVDDHIVGKVLDVTEDDIEASVLGMPVDPTLLTNYPTHVAILIWRY